MKTSFPVKGIPIIKIIWIYWLYVNFILKWSPDFDFKKSEEFWKRSDINNELDKNDYIHDCILYDDWNNHYELNYVKCKLNYNMQPIPISYSFRIKM